MASTQGITSGSPLCGSPIYLGVTAADLSAVAGATFHRIVLKIKAGIDSFREFRMSHACKDKESLNIDISSALRAVGEQYKYTPDAATYPLIKWQVEIWDEYLLDGELKTLPSVFFPSNTTYDNAILGEYSALERILTDGTKRVRVLSRKPSTSPQIVRVGETFAHTPPLVLPKDYPYDGYTFHDIIAPFSQIVNITKTGAQTIGGISLYALPASNSEDNYEFRFINRLGVLESISVHALRETDVDIISEEFTVASEHSFSDFVNNTIRKQNDYESWKLTSGPLDHAWLQWFLHEFLMAEHVWMFLPTKKNTNGSIIHGGSAVTEGQWLKVHIATDETQKGINRLSTDIMEVPFTVKLDFPGSPLLTI